jgi:Family of unknown function (DUF5343)
MVAGKNSSDTLNPSILFEMVDCFSISDSEGLKMLPPFMNSYGLITKIFDKIISASQPERFTQDFLKTKLGYDSGSARPFIPLLKRLSFISSDGTPTSLYSKFRNKDTRGTAMAQAIRNGYADVYERNEYVHDLDKSKLKNLIIEMTGQEPDSPTVGAVVNTFIALKTYANFEEHLPQVENGKKAEFAVVDRNIDERNPSPDQTKQQHMGLNLSYTINLNLPETSDVEVFNAIFRSLKENLLKV